MKYFGEKFVQGFHLQQRLENADFSLISWTCLCFWFTVHVIHVILPIRRDLCFYNTNAYIKQMNLNLKLS